MQGAENKRVGAAVVAMIPNEASIAGRQHGVGIDYQWFRIAVEIAYRGCFRGGEGARLVAPKFKTGAGGDWLGAVDFQAYDRAGGIDPQAQGCGGFPGAKGDEEGTVLKGQIVAEGCPWNQWAGRKTHPHPPQFE